MDFMNRIANIESRIGDIEAQANSIAPPVSEANGANFQAMLNQSMNETPAQLPPGTSAYVPGTTPAGLTEAAAVPGAAAPVASASTASGGQFDSFINDAASQFGVDPNLVKSVIQQESAFNPKATSSCGAQGLMQLMPETAKELGCTDAMDPQQNVNAGTKYLKQLLDQFHGDSSLALAAYNAGPQSVTKYNGIPPFAETQNYVKNILGYYSAYKRGS